MDEDPRFPNRKKKRDWDDMSALDKPVAPGQPGPDGTPTEEAQLPQNIYRVVESAKKTKEDELRERQELYAYRESIPATHQASVETPVYSPIDETAAPQQQPGSSLRDRIKKFGESQTRVYAAIGVGLGILLGIIVASIMWFAGPPNGRYDLGPATASAAGLKGHLFVEWDKQLNYRLSIEPEDPARQAAFATAVANSPQPLSIEIHLQDSEGFVLCSREILLKYNVRNAIQLAPPSPQAQDVKPDAQGAKTNAGALPVGQPAPVADFTQADAQEAAREKGREIFKNQVGPDGKITGLSAQGVMPCTAKAYEKAVAWSFSPNFQTIAEQDRLAEPQQEIANPEPTPAETPGPHRKTVAKAVQKIVPFSIEGDDSIVDFDTSRGIIETTSGKAFLVDKASGAISDPRWQDYPVEIHYRCDRGSDCTLMHRGTGALHVRIRQ